MGHGSTSMKLVIAGATGFIGSILTDRLWNEFHDLTLLSRRPAAEVNVTKKQWFAWQPGFRGEWEKAVDGADGIINLIQQHEEIRKIRRTLTNGVKFPDFSEKDLLGNPLSVSKYEDKVVLVEFWATWCGPCVAELPNIIKAYNKHHSNGFEVIGISLDQDEQKLKSFLKAKEIPWVQYFDGKGWQNKLAAKYGIDRVPATFLLDRQGKIIGQGLRGEALEEALTKALANTR